MEPGTDPDAGATPRQRVTNACEACRAAKVKCQTSVQLGTCRRCLDFKRECIFRTGPRTRRPRQSKQNQDAPRPPPPPGPSKTFSIDFEMPQVEEADDLDNLAARHDKYLEEFLPPESDMESIDMMFGLDGSGSDPHSAISSPPSSGPSVSVASFGLKPQFNLDSAEKLLSTFRVMLKHFPCVALPPDATVTSLSKTKPFVLLAILSTASATSALQGHTLYDEEFRKILGLKFVAGGERTLELLQGLLIYTAWYPFHLRPKNKQAFQYVRMAAEILHDLELDHPPHQGAGSPANGSAATASSFAPDQMDGIRAYVSCYYLVSAHVLPFLQYFRRTTLTDARFAMAWAKMAILALDYTSWTAACCDLLEQHSALKGDHTLAWLARLVHITEESSAISKTMPQGEQAKQQVHFMFLGLESQLREWQSRIPSSLSDINSLTLANLFTEMFLLAGPIYTLRSTAKIGDSDLGPPIPAHRLEKCLTLLRTLFDFMVNLPSSAFVELSSIDWGRFIQAVILAIRISFPMPLCPEWDHARAREQLQFDSYLARLCADSEELTLTPATKTSMDVLSAGKVVFAVVKRKYEARIANIETPVNKLPRTIRGCPMFDGSLDQYFPIWDQDMSRDGTHGLFAPAPNGTPAMVNGQPIYDDLWATMTMNWPDGMTGASTPGFDLSQAQDLTVNLDPSFQGAMNLGPSPSGSG
ncbi:hypothetical protein CORC01_01246 [Colletotrichum orchidophilum]|uniref:Zn(2)-C6 fungal-type domain-containing protein n=1 Tax=Colletotrichum orchidophilum TaxID=1209926 RepID=A0A1G4BQG9_9PEZI|nr:uncharacterized protein CORC01_01246 [Colletotrichum orchidophilum]OHF03527.1 hypothetical protein CORC01_01246 [Colletotrichum orchidophilum]